MPHKVFNLSGVPKTFDTNKILRAKYKDIAANLRNPQYIQMAKMCETFLTNFENHNYKFEKNGELNLLNKLKKVYPNMKTVFDIGMNVGDWSDFILTNFPKAHIYGFDPSPPVRATLNKKYSRNDRVTLTYKGLSNKPGNHKFYFCQRNIGASGLYKKDIIIKSEYDEYNVEVMKGDSFVNNHPEINKIDFMKIDVEGVEYEVIQGLLKTLKNKRVNIIQFEYNDGWILSGHTLYQMYNILKPLGYVIGDIFQIGVQFRDYSWLHENYMGPNFIAVREDMPDVINALKTF